VLQTHNHGTEISSIVIEDMYGQWIGCDRGLLILMEQNRPAWFEVAGIQLVSLQEGGIVAWLVVVEFLREVLTGWPFTSGLCTNCNRCYCQQAGENSGNHHDS